jgi:hypothetical protein
MEKELDKLYDIFYARNFDDNDVNARWFIEEIEEINEKFALNIPINVDSMKAICQEIYENDNVELVEHLILGSTCFDWDRYDAEYDFEPADWVEDNEDREYYDENYGEQGTDYYAIETKSKKVIFSHLRHFDLPYELHEIIDKTITPENQ